MTDRMSAQTSVISASSIATTPMNAGHPCTEPLNVTAHCSMGNPAVMPAFPFHFDHSDVKLITRKTANATNNRRVGIVSLSCLRPYPLANLANCL